ncbi:hypothetical protein IGI04_030091 [Brassica rapa subsp. trilocularis]|uniref:Uncharacterized protein n=1 Tax=Brassica rapa subsp. trilocularis TaxID=1813537 RepID=A0ABQ7LR98_BRACM|nr:hypothetical protein IGI04_030091 [Brassica rapa subsp. trilocularis]
MKDIRLNHKVFLWVCSAVHSTCKDYGEESHGWSYLCKPSGRNTLAAAFRPRKTMHVVKILRLMAAVSTFRMALLLAEVTLQTHTWLIAICFFVVSINGRTQDNTVSYLFSRSSSLAVIAEYSIFPCKYTFLS